MAMQNNDQRESPRRESEQHMLPLEDPDQRPPQLNMTICGCQCGSVSRSRGGDEGGSRDGEADRDYRRGEEGADDGSIVVPMPMTPLGSVQHLFTEYADYDVDEDGGFHLGRRNVNLEDPFKKVAEPHDPLHSPESLAMHLHTTEVASVYSSDRRTRRSDSPGPMFTAIGTWTTSSYVFNPLSLTPQHIIPQNARLAMVGQEIYPGSIESDDLKDECHC